MGSEKIEITIPKVGTFSMGTWEWSCVPPRSEFVAAPKATLGFVQRIVIGPVLSLLIEKGAEALVTSHRVNVAVDSRKVLEALGLAGKLIPGAGLQDFIEAAADVAPSGRMGLSVDWVFLSILVPCRNDSERVSLVGYSLRVRLVARAEGQFGASEGTASLSLDAEVLSDMKECDCTKTDKLVRTVVHEASLTSPRAT